MDAPEYTFGDGMLWDADSPEYKAIFSNPLLSWLGAGWEEQTLYLSTKNYKPRVGNCASQGQVGIRDSCNVTSLLQTVNSLPKTIAINRNCSESLELSISPAFGYVLALWPGLWHMPQCRESVRQLFDDPWFPPSTRPSSSTTRWKMRRVALTSYPCSAGYTIVCHP
ncbi:hypothetical protein VTK56DRAFT_8907 [Thermocarpiscus australiensis]